MIEAILNPLSFNYKAQHTPALDRLEMKQVIFPKRKSIRIRKKYAKNLKNYRLVEVDNVLYDENKKLFMMSTSAWNAFKKSMSSNSY